MEASEITKAARKEARRNFTGKAVPAIFTAGQMRTLGGMNHATADKLAAAGQFPPPTHATASATFWNPEDEVVTAWLDACRAIHIEGHHLSHKLPVFRDWARPRHAAAPDGWPVVRLLSQGELAIRAGFDQGRSWVNLRNAGKTPPPSFVARWGYLYALTDELEAWAEAAAATKGKAWPRVDAVPVFGKGAGQ